MNRRRRKFPIQFFKFSFKKLNKVVLFFFFYKLTGNKYNYVRVDAIAYASFEDGRPKIRGALKWYIIRAFIGVTVRVRWLLDSDLVLCHRKSRIGRCGNAVMNLSIQGPSTVAEDAAATATTAPGFFSLSAFHSQVPSWFMDDATTWHIECYYRCIITSDLLFISFTIHSFLYFGSKKIIYTPQ